MGKSFQQVSLSGIWLFTFLLNNPKNRELANVRLGFQGFSRSINDMGNDPKNGGLTITADSDILNLTG
jgi:hypothetical protein